ncbi:MAG: hypothetical protein QXO22_06575 [Thermosphaera sp.]
MIVRVSKNNNGGFKLVINNSTSLDVDVVVINNEYYDGIKMIGGEIEVDVRCVEVIDNGGVYVTVLECWER